MSYLKLLLAAALYFVAFFPLTPSLANAPPPSNSASNLFKQGHYQQALNAYLAQQALPSSKRDEHIHYKIAVCYYKLKQWDRAKTYFNKALEADAFNESALYSLGVVYKKLGQYDKAKSLFYNLSLEALDEDLSNAAYQQYSNLKNQVKTKTAHTPQKYSGIVGLLSTSIGNDANVLVQGEETASEESDLFVESIVNINWIQNTRKKSGWGASFLVFDSNYQSEDDYNVRAYSVGLDHNWFIQSSRLQLAASASKSDVGGQGYMQDLKLELTWLKDITPTLQYRLRASTTNSEEQSPFYTPYAGSALSFKGRLVKKLAPHRFTVEATFKQMDKNDFSDSTEFKSYSGNRYELKAGYAYRSTDWYFGASLSHRNTQYDGTYTIESEPQGQRKDNHSKIQLNLEYDFNKHLTAFLEFNHGNNSSNITTYDYDQGAYILGVSWAFESF